jgi:hypothetical protein
MDTRTYKISSLSFTVTKTLNQSLLQKLFHIQDTNTDLCKFDFTLYSHRLPGNRILRKVHIYDENAKKGRPHFHVIGWANTSI